MGDHFAGPGVDRAHDGLRAEFVGERGEDRGIVERGAVHGDLVGAGTKQRPRVVETGDAAADGERDRQRRGGALDQLENGAAALEGGRDVEEHELVGTELRVSGRELDRLSHLT